MTYDEEKGLRSVGGKWSLRSGLVSPSVVSHVRSMLLCVPFNGGWRVPTGAV